MSDETKRLDFIREIIVEHNRTGRFGGPCRRASTGANGYLHLGHPGPSASTLASPTSMVALQPVHG